MNNYTRPNAALGLLLGVMLTAGQMAMRAQTQLSLGEALNCTNLVWTTGGTEPMALWIGQTNVTHDGLHAVQASGMVANYQESFIQTSVTGPTYVTFWWKCYGTHYISWMEFQIGGTAALSTRFGNTEVDWEPHTIQIPAGTQTLRWVFKNSNLAPAKDERFWLDQVSLSGPLAPSFLVQPTNQVALAGSSPTVTAQVPGTEPLSWQWLCNGTNMPGSNGQSLAFADIQPPGGGDFSVVVTNAFGAITSQVATLIVVDAAPSFTLQPTSEGSLWGTTASFTGTASGSKPLAWQWYFNGEAIAGATTNSLIVSNVLPAKLGEYFAVVTNAFGSVTSAVASLSFSPLAVWGWNYIETTRVPSGLTNIISMAGGDYHGMALQADGKIAVWGENTYGAEDVPADATNVMAIAAGSLHCLALRDDGAVVRWGPMFNTPWLDTPPQASNLVALALGPGAEHALVLRADGNVFEIGNYGYNLTYIPSAVTNIVGVAAGALHSVALRADGKVLAWGYNYNGGETSVPSSATNAVAIAAGWHHSLALRRDGSLVTWGYDWGGSGLTKIPAGATNIVSIACGGVHSMALREDGRLFAWGYGSYGQTNIWPWATNLLSLAGMSMDSMALTGGPEPMFTQQPRSCAALLNDQPRFIASVAGARPMSLQWLRNGTPLPGESSSWLVLPPTLAPDDASYCLVASNAFGVTTSRLVGLGFVPLPRIVEQPASVVAVPSNSVVRLRVAAVSLSPVSFAWQFNGTNLADGGRITGAGTSLLTISGIQPENLGAYTVVATNDSGAVTSLPSNVRFGTASETVAEAVDATDHAFTMSGGGFFYQTDVTADGLDAARSAPIGNNASVKISTTQTGPVAVSFSWKVSSEPGLDLLKFSGPSGEVIISGETGWENRSFWLPLSVVNPYSLTWTYTKNSSGAAGQDCGWVDQIRFGSPVAPVILEGPRSIVAYASTNVTIKSRASGTEPLTHYLIRDGQLVSTRTPSPDSRAWSFTLPAVAGQYSVIVSNAAGTTTSAPATLLMLPATASREPLATRQPGGSLRITWSYGTLESAETPTGPWFPLPSATSPMPIPPVETSRFYRVRLLQ